MFVIASEFPQLLGNLTEKKMSLAYAFGLGSSLQRSQFSEELPEARVALSLKVCNDIELPTNFVAAVRHR